jgi:hypothetical protein
MILRRLSTALRKQDWVTVFVETLIVVFGVFIGLQVNNWNQARQQHALGEAYLSRMTDDLSAMELYLEEKLSDARMRYDLTLNLLQAASAQDGPDDDLIIAAEAFFTDAWVTPQFTIIDAVYQDMSATGNLNLIDKDFRQHITRYYDGLELQKENMNVNRDWSLPVDSRVIYELDVYRWNRDLAEISGTDSLVVKQETILSARADLARLATLYFYIERSTVTGHEASLTATKSLIAAIDGTERLAP